MRKRIPILRGLAILAVVSYHCAAWGHTAMFFWAHRFRQVESHSFDQFGSLPYSVLLAIERLAWFSVPAFLFISGFSMAYAASGKRGTISWKTVGARISHVLWPYLIWSSMIFLGDGVFLKIRYSPLEYLEQLAFGRAVGLYYFVPLLIQFYILSPFITRWAKRNPGLLLLGAAAIQATMHYFVHAQLSNIAYPWGFFHWSFFFPFGAVCFLHYQRAKVLLARFKWLLLIAAASLCILSAREVVQLFSGGASFDSAHHMQGFLSSLYALTFISAFLAFDKAGIPFAGMLRWIGSRSYGLYLLHFTVQIAVSKLIYQYAPWLLDNQVLYQPVLLLTGLGLPLIVMQVVAGSSLRKYYRYLFGPVTGASLHPTYALVKDKDVVKRRNVHRRDAVPLGIATTSFESRD